MESKTPLLKVTHEQIEQLYDFTRQHFVEYYDLQTELVDHLANAIETTWQQQPGLSFENALQAEFKKFGIFGFSDVVERRQVALSKKYYRLMWSYFKQFFKLPHILLTLLLMFVTYKILKFEPMLFLVFMGIVLITILVKVIVYKGRYGKKVKDTGKRWLLEEIINNCGGITGFIGIPFQFFHFAVKDHVNFSTLCLLTGVIVFSALISYIMLFVIPAKAELHLAALYPEYNL